MPPKRSSVSKHIRRTFGGLEVVDAVKDLRILILPEDLRGAERKSPDKCVFARACKRLYGSSKVLFFHSVAYVELVDSKGQQRVERFYLTADMRRLVEAFDQDISIIPKAGFLLIAPPPCERLDRKIERRKAVEARRAAGLVGEISEVVQGNSQRGRAKTTPKLHDAELVRSGSGQIQFHKKEPTL